MSPTEQPGDAAISVEKGMDGRLLRQLVGLPTQLVIRIGRQKWREAERWIAHGAHNRVIAPIMPILVPVYMPVKSDP